MRKFNVALTNYDWKTDNTWVEAESFDHAIKHLSGIFGRKAIRSVILVDTANGEERTYDERAVKKLLD